MSDKPESKTKKKTGLTPLMQQYFEIKEQYPGLILLFQVGDFYELFFEDATEAASYLGIALTKRGTYEGNPIPLCGVPLHALEHYLIKLIKGGFQVAICDQLEPAQTGKVVRRGVTKVLTPGTLTDSGLLQDKSQTYLSSLWQTEEETSLISVELLTGQLLVTTISNENTNSIDKVLEEELLRMTPAEIILAEVRYNSTIPRIMKRLGIAISVAPPVINSDTYDEWIDQQFITEQAQKVRQSEGAYGALFQLYRYLTRNQPDALAQFSTIQWYKPESYLVMDTATQRNLELVKTLDGEYNNSLFSHMDKALTPMGSRVIKQWIVRPLCSKQMITYRQDCIQYFNSNPQVLKQVQDLFKGVSDIERVIGRIALNRGQLHDYVNLMNVLSMLPSLKQVMLSVDVPLVHKHLERLGEFAALAQLLQASINDDRNSDFTIKPGFDHELDRLRDLLLHGNQRILELEQQEQEKTNISSLKIRYNNVHGYYIEVTKANLSMVPEYFTHTQTLVGKSRFTTEELKVLEADLLKAKLQVEQIEQAVYDRVKSEVKQEVTKLRHTAHALAHIDALQSLAEVALRYGYIRPEINDGNDIVIEQGKHPIVAAQMKTGFIPNDTTLAHNERFWIITGPNMGGKSTYLRQVSLICIMAQIGSYVPAKMASVPVLDQLFTRIGASDNLSEGKSTFLVEMEETASICSRATPQSLVILDEVGRGTSTFDGLAIAHAVVEYLYQTIQARTLFATHYHELTQLESQYEGISCYHATSKETPNGILFLHTIVKGVADGSFGLEVAKLAGLPQPLVDRAAAILQDLDSQEQNMVRKPGKEVGDVMRLEKELTEAKKRLQVLESINYDDLSPKQALDLLWELK